MSGFLDRLLAVPDAQIALVPDPDLAAAAALACGPTLPYGALRDRALRVGGWLVDQGVAPGDRVAIHLENSVDLIDLHLGCVAVGATRVPLNAHYRAAELAPILEDAAPSLVVSRTPDQVGPGHRVVTGIGAGPQLPGFAAASDGFPTALLFTSGTTGRAKGVPQTWSMWEANLDALAVRWELDPTDRLWLALPLFHTHGLVLGLHGTLLRGASARLSARFDPVPPPPDCSHVFGVPTWYRRWLPSMQRADFAHLRLVVSGSDGLPADVSDAVFAATGHRILERYGMTETVMIASNPFRGERRPGSVGTPLDGVAVRLVAGEIQVRGPSVFAGYLRPDPAAFDDGWFRTGDAGAFDPDGYLRLVGRQKELIIVGGVNVSPAEVEQVLATVSGVAEVGCCGLPDEDLVEVVGAAVVLDGTVPESVVRDGLAAAARGLSGLKRPKVVAVVAALPRNALGKLQRARIRDLLTGPPG